MFRAVLARYGSLPGRKAWSASTSSSILWSAGPSVHYATLPTTHKVKAISARRMKKWMEAEMKRRRRRDARTSENPDKGAKGLRRALQAEEHDVRRMREGMLEAVARSMSDRGNRELTDRLVGKGINLTKVKKEELQ